MLSNHIVRKELVDYSIRTSGFHTGFFAGGGGGGGGTHGNPCKPHPLPFPRHVISYTATDMF